MDKFLASLEGQRPTLDDATRLKLQDALRQAADSLETPFDTMLRFMNSVRHITIGVLTEANRQGRPIRLP
jgi:hypothetical protein